MIYFDNSATTKVHPEVMKTFVAVNEKFWANPASIHEFGHQTNELLQTARKQVAEILHTSADKIYFTSGGTESNNLAIFGLANKYKNRGRHVLVSAIEHPSVLEAAKQLMKNGFEVEWIPVNSEGVIIIDALKKLLRDDTVLVSVMHVNNETGVIQPIQELIAYIRGNSRALIHMDAVQSFGKLPVDFAEMDVDAITISSHKIHGLKGSGLLALKTFIEVEPMLLGGGQEYGIRSGTTPVPLAVCTAKAIRLAQDHLQANASKLKKMTDELIHFLVSFPAIKIISPSNRAPHIVSFSVRKIKGEVLINALQQKNVIVSTSSACSSRHTKTSHVLKAMHLQDEYIKGVIRLSFSPLNTKEEIDQFKKVFTNVMNVIKGD
ncbi:cysteine desulfurase family protein [Psychrobacillus lasiicapitis]|uniref:Cysteine desulfurase n=1 Tax=Psychrobacillus lasiicapitis TaxID=1636719 RepID=A0A544T946_9BACI|nr:cysteine desulfurase family protein [Psychrobacillus lasiicapitis]TQR13973.1 cysteine desulfurase [Psychrobacillus lasiicapitis]GGA37072.1 aminotransferase V [Psychrobacillus lasiicapitis]